MSNSEADMIRIVEEIIGLNQQMRFVALIDSHGVIIEAIMKSGKHSLKSQREEEYFCRQVVQRRKMRQEFDESLGGVRYVHVEREKLTQIVVYTKNHTVYFTMEPEMTIEDKLAITARVKDITSEL